MIDIEVNGQKPILCPHIEEEKLDFYRSVELANLKIWFLLCRACWGELVVSVRDWFLSVDVKVR